MIQEQQQNYGNLTEISSIINKEIVTNDICMGSFSLYLETSVGFYSICLRSLQFDQVNS